jgi:hypothetical protein
MPDEHTNQIRQIEHRLPEPRYLSSSEAAAVLQLLGELRSLTLSRNSHSLATELMVVLGGEDGWMRCSIATPEWQP